MFKEYIYKLFNSLHNPIVSLFTYISMFFAPIAGIVFSAIVLAIVDFLIRLVGVFKNEGYSSIQSNKMATTLQKCTLYGGLIIVCHILDIVFVQKINVEVLKFILSPDSVELISKAKLSSAVAFMIVLREIKSIDENWKYATGWSFIETFGSIASELLKLKNKQNDKPVE